MQPKEEREREIDRLQTEYRAVLHTPLISDGAISPFELGLMSKRQHEKWQRDAQMKMIVRSRIRDLRRIDAEILKEEDDEAQQKKAARIAYLQNSISTWRQFGVGKSGKVKPTYRRCIDKAQAELDALTTGF